MVPGNVKVGQVEWPVGIALIFLVLLLAASVNMLTKPVATISGGIFAVTFFAILMGSERFLSEDASRPRRTRPPGSRSSTSRRPTSFSPDALKLEKDDRVLVGVRSERSLEMLKRYLAEVNPEKTDVVVVAADVVPRRASAPMPGLSHADQELLSKVVKIAEEVGKPVHPLVVPTDDPIEALTQIARAIHAREIVLGASKRLKPKKQLDQIEKSWQAGEAGDARPLTIRVLGKERDDRRDLAAGR